MRDEVAAQPLGIDAQASQAGQVVARREREAELREEVGSPPVQRHLEHRDRELCARQLAELLDDERALRRIDDELPLLACEFQQLAAMRVRHIGPDVKRVYERIAVEA